MPKKKERKLKRVILTDAVIQDLVHGTDKRVVVGDYEVIISYRGKAKVNKDYEGFMDWLKKNRSDVILRDGQKTIAEVYFRTGKVFRTPDGYGKSFVKNLIKEYLSI